MTIIIQPYYDKFVILKYKCREYPNYKLAKNDFMVRNRYENDLKLKSL
jgi:hypothetical protein